MPHDGPDRDSDAAMRIMGGVDTEVVTDSPADFDDALRARLAAGSDVARAAVEEFAAGGVGEHLGHEVEAPFTTTHRFASDLSGYRGWHWACVLALVPGGDVTIDEISLLPGPDAVVAPEWVPWEKRIRPGDLGAGDLLPAADDDERLVPGHWLTDDDEINDLLPPVGLGRPRHLSPEGRAAAAQRWTEARGPQSEIARGAKRSCGSCGFLQPITGSLGGMFGVCANEYSADGQVVHLEYGCGAHSEVQVSNEQAARAGEAYDDSAVDVVVLPQQLAASVAKRGAQIREAQGSAGESQAEAGEAQAGAGEAQAEAGESQAGAGEAGAGAGEAQSGVGEAGAGAGPEIGDASDATPEAVPGPEAAPETGASDATPTPEADAEEASGADEAGEAAESESETKGDSQSDA